MRAKSVKRKLNDPVQRTGLLEQMGRAWYDGHVYRSGQACGRSFVQIQHLEVAATDDEQCGCTNSFERVSGEVRSTASRDHQLNMIRNFRSGNKGCRCARAGAE